MKQIVLDQWQKDALDHKGDLLLCTGRQIGKTYILARKSVKRMVEKPNTRIIIVSLTEDQAQLIIMMILRHLTDNHKIMIAKGKKSPTKGSITLKNGSKVLARPCGQSGSALRGFTGDILIIDEGSRMPEDAFIAAEPTLLSMGGEVWMASTPFGKKGYFWDQYNAAVQQDESEIENDMGWKVIHVNGEEAITNRPISEVWTEERRMKSLKRLEKIKKRWTALRYGQEILAIFTDDLQAMFSDELIDKICKGERTDNKRGDYFMGCDISRFGGDQTTYEIIKKVNDDMMIQVESIFEDHKPTTHTYKKIVYLEQQWDFQKIGIDAGSGSLGVGIYDFLLQDEVTKRKVINLDNAQRMMDHLGEKTDRALKEGMYQYLLMLMEMNKIQLLDDAEVRLSLKSVQMEFVVKDGQKTKIKIFGRYTHIVEGLVRACWLAKDKSLDFWIR